MYTKIKTCYFRNKNQFKSIDAGSLWKLIHGNIILVDDDQFIKLPFKENKLLFYKVETPAPLLNVMDCNREELIKLISLFLTKIDNAQQKENNKNNLEELNFIYDELETAYFNLKNNNSTPSSELLNTVRLQLKHFTKLI